MIEELASPPPPKACRSCPRLRHRCMPSQQQSEVITTHPMMYVALLWALPTQTT
jgi:hypothetical protein